MNFEDLWNDDTLTLNNTDEHEIQYFLPPPALAPYINLFYIFRSKADVIRDVQPASAGHVMFFLAGHGEVRFVDGIIQPSHKISLIGPSTSAMQYIVKGPVHFIAFTFNPAGFSTLTGQKAIAGLNKLADAASVLGNSFADAFVPILAATEAVQNPDQDAHMIDALAAFLTGKFKPLKPTPTAAIKMMFDLLDDKLDIDLDEFYRELPVAPRQMQRFCKDYLGSPPKYLIRKFRAVRAAMLLCDPHCTQETRDHVQNHFYDQSHMIREISLFSGRTPKYLSGEVAPLFKMWFDSVKQTEMTGIYSKTLQLAQPDST